MKIEKKKPDEKNILDYSTQAQKNPWESGWRAAVLEFIIDFTIRILLPAAVVAMLWAYFKFW